MIKTVVQWHQLVC